MPLRGHRGLGVIHILQRETLPNQLTVRWQAGNFGSVRGFAAWSPDIRRRDAIFAYEGSHTDGPFETPLDYERHNVTGNYTCDNMFDCDYRETQNHFESRLAGEPPAERIHATPGYGRTWAVGLTVKLGGK